MGIFLRNFPKTEEGKKLNLEEELKKELIVVYRKTDDNDGWEYHGLKNDVEDYFKDDIFVPVESVYGGYVGVKAGTPFVNVIGSTHDPKPDTSWINLMRNVYSANGFPVERLNYCCTDGNFYDSITHNIIVNNRCTDTIVGGHVLLGETVNQETRAGSIVYLLPICSPHNVCRLNGNVTGAYYYMKTKYDIVAVQLNRFLMRAQVEPYLKQDSHSGE